MIRRPPRSTRTDTLFPYTTLFRSHARLEHTGRRQMRAVDEHRARTFDPRAIEIADVERHVGAILAVENQGKALAIPDAQDDERGQAIGVGDDAVRVRSEEHTSELQSLMRISYAVFCLKKKNTTRQ